DVVGAGNEMATQDQRERGGKSAAALRSYFADEIDKRRHAPTDDLVGRLVQANENDTVTDAELLAACVLLLLAGHETTTKLIGNAVLALARDPEARGQLARDPALLPGAVEELVRFAGPVQSSVRLCTVGTRLDE